MSVEDLVSRVDDPNTRVSESVLELLAESPLIFSDIALLAWGGTIETKVSLLNKPFKRSEIRRLSAPQTHVANTRANPHWRHRHGGVTVRGRDWWQSPHLVVPLGKKRDFLAPTRQDPPGAQHRRRPLDRRGTATSLKAQYPSLPPRAGQKKTPPPSDNTRFLSVFRPLIFARRANTRCLSGLVHCRQYQAVCAVSLVGASRRLCSSSPETLSLRVADVVRSRAPRGDWRATRCRLPVRGTPSIQTTLLSRDWA